MASESDGNYDKSFKAKGTTYYIEMLSDGGNYVAKWWDSSDNGLGYNNKGWVAIEGKNYRALNNIEDVNSDNVVDILSVISDYDRKPGKPIQDRIKREVAKLIDFDSINSSCGKRSIKAGTTSRDNVKPLSVGQARVFTFRGDPCIFVGVPGGMIFQWYSNSYAAKSELNYVKTVIKQLPNDWEESLREYGFDQFDDTVEYQTWSAKNPVNSSCGKKSVKADAIMGADDISGVKILVRSKAYVDITEDSYEHGASLGVVNQWDFDVRGEYDSMQALIDDIHSVSYQVFSDNIDDYSFGDGALRTSAMVNDENDVPTDGEYEAFKRGEITLYIADMWLPLEVDSVHDMTDDEAMSLGLKEIW